MTINNAIAQTNTAKKTDIPSAQYSLDYYRSNTFKLLVEYNLTVSLKDNAILKSLVLTNDSKLSNLIKIAVTNSNIDNSYFEITINDSSLILWGKNRNYSKSFK